MASSLARGPHSALLGCLQGSRALQLFLEARGPAGNSVVTTMVRRCPVMVHAVYVTPHAFVVLAQSASAMSFLQVSPSRLVACRGRARRRAQRVSWLQSLDGTPGRALEQAC